MDAKQLPVRPSLEQFRKQAKDLLKARESFEATQRIKKFHPRFRKLTESQITEAKLSLADAQWVIAREHAVSKFELAADAIVTGDLAGLKHLLRENPHLVRARSTREHEAPLIHYVAANGIEDFRQKTPRNIVEIARALIESSAEVDATTNAYGGPSTALGLAATSYHSAKAGVQLGLLDELLNSGACVDGAPGGWNPLVAALHNGRGEAAGFLANRGARLDLEGAAGTGRVTEVASYVDQDGSLRKDATTVQLNHGFIWACEFGCSDVVALLLNRGVELDDNFMQGQTGLHWAALGGHAETVDLLLKANAKVNAKEKVHGGTPLGWALYGWTYPAPEFKNARYHDVVESLIRASALVDWEWIESPNRGSSLIGKLQADSRMIIALGSRK